MNFPAGSLLLFFSTRNVRLLGFKPYTEMYAKNEGAYFKTSRPRSPFFEGGRQGDEDGTRTRTNTKTYATKASAAD